MLIWFRVEDLGFNSISDFFWLHQNACLHLLCCLIQTRAKCTICKICRVFYRAMALTRRAIVVITPYLGKFVFPTMLPSLKINPTGYCKCTISPSPTGRVSVPSICDPFHDPLPKFAPPEPPKLPGCAPESDTGLFAESSRCCPIRDCYVLQRFAS